MPIAAPPKMPSGHQRGTKAAKNPLRPPLQRADHRHHSRLEKVSETSVVVISSNTAITHLHNATSQQKLHTMTASMYRSSICDACRAQQSRLVQRLARTSTTSLTAPSTIATQARALYNSSPRVSTSLPSRPFSSSSTLRYKTVEEAKSKYRLGVCPPRPNASLKKSR